MKTSRAMLGLFLLLLLLTNLTQAAEKSLEIDGDVKGSGVTYEQKIGSKLTLLLGGAILEDTVVEAPADYGVIYRPADEVFLTMYTARIGASFYPVSAALRGFFINVSGMAASLRLSHKTDSRRGYWLAATARTGYKWILKNGYTINLYGRYTQPLLASVTVDGQPQTVPRKHLPSSAGLGSGFGYTW